MATVNLMDFSGDTALQAAGQLTPLATLTFYRHGLMLRRPTKSGGMTEYPVSPAALASLLGERQVFTTGLLHPNTLWVGQSGTVRKIVYYRPPQVTGLWLEGSDEPVRIPLPGLVMCRVTNSGASPRYSIHAVKERPDNPNSVLFLAPLPNTDRSGTCWGTVAAPRDLSGNDLEEDLTNFLGSKFGSHTTSGKSQRKKYKEDIRKLWLDLHKAESAEYPLEDLVEVGSFGDLLELKS